MTSLRICLVASEVAPFAKTGGLADVAAGLARYLDRTGHDVRLVMPMYGPVREGGFEFQPVAALQDVHIQLGDRALSFSVSTASLPQSDAQVWFVRCPELYGRTGIYTDGPDEPLRFALLTRAAIEMCQRLQWPVDVFHCNDWHTALLPLYLKTTYAWDGLFAASKSLLAIHNIGYQGVFGLESLDDIGLGRERHLFDRSDVEAGRFSFLRTGVRYADGLCTVSRTYADEIRTEEFVMGLEDLLQERRSDLVGIVNGVDYGDWDPATDTLIAQRYSAAEPGGKAADKRALQEEFGLRQDAAAPLCGVVSRLTFQKGFELVAEVLPALLQRAPLQLVALGTGEEKYERFFTWLAEQWPEQVGYHQGYDNALAHRIEAGADLFLMPSRYEPCGLNQMYSLKYGTVPVVRRTGGLADTVQDWDPETRQGTGFVFDTFDSNALYAAMGRALETYGDRDAWAALVQNGMACDYSWDVQGPLYVELYRTLLGR